MTTFSSVKFLDSDNEETLPCCFSNPEQNLIQGKKLFESEPPEEMIKRLNYYKNGCNCPYLGFITDGSKNPYSYMQCCLRRPDLCKREDFSHSAVFNLIDKIVENIKSGCNGRICEWQDRVKILGKELEQVKFVYKGVSNLYPNPQQGLQLNAKWKTQAFLSTSYDFKRAAGYVYNWGLIEESQEKFLLHFKLTDDVEGAFIEKCSELKQDKEFLIQPGQCWKVYSINREQTLEYIRYADYQKHNYTDIIKIGANFTFVKLVPDDNCSDQSPILL